jgi:uncharacterized membrane protein (DUF2068 family)
MGQGAPVISSPEPGPRKSPQAGSSGAQLEIPGMEAPRIRKRAPTLYAIITFKLIKGVVFVILAIVAYTLSDNDLPTEYRQLLHHLRLNPERKFWVALASQIGKLTEAKVLWAAAGTLTYSLFSLVEGFGLMFRVPWAGWLAIGESAFFIPIELYEIAHGASVWVMMILLLNILIVWYLYQNREQLFRHTHRH